MSTFDLTTIVKILEFKNVDKINRHLEIGWKLLGISSNQYSEKGFNLSYSVGWSKESGEIQYPELTEMETLLEKR